ncbi:MAG: Xylose isomerase domain protein barrel [Pedosphaera sp.]|nr:Xylose isomerase domain protein barrel [Pedosphaera sp.]
MPVYNCRMTAPGSATSKPPLFQISLAEWSLHRSLEGGTLPHLDFPQAARRDYGIDVIELVNTFFKDKARDQGYLTDFKKRADDLGVQVLLIMCDHEGALGDVDETKRTQAVENHYKWVEAAQFLGCHSIRVNAQSSGSADEQRSLVADGLGRLAEFAAKAGLNVLVENHGGLSSDGAWLVSVIKQVGLPNCGTLPDFGNFKLADGAEYDRYQGVTETMPFAKAVSAKAQEFDASGNEVRIDYRRMMQIVLEAGYHGYVGIEYSGDKLNEPEGILATKKLLETVRDELSREDPL